MFGKNKKNGSKSKNSRKALVIEDDALLAKVLIETITKKGFKTLGLKNGLDTIEVAKEFKPDIILLDLILPGLDGFEVLKSLKSDSETKGIPVFVISNLQGEADVKSAKALGAEEYFIKAKTQIDQIVELVDGRIK